MSDEAIYVVRLNNYARCLGDIRERPTAPNRTNASSRHFLSGPDNRDDFLSCNWVTMRQRVRDLAVVGPVRPPLVRSNVDSGWPMQQTVVSARVKAEGIYSAVTRRRTETARSEISPDYFRVAPSTGSATPPY